MAEDKNKKKKDLLRRFREFLLSKSEGARKGDKSGLEQIEELATEEEKKKKR
jgi:hypothetical protein